jgi:hypothetical protein
MVEDKMVDLQQRLKEARKVVQERSAAADDWHRRAKDVESKLIAERATVASQQEEYATLVSFV